MTTLEKTLIGVVVFLIGSGAFAAWWAYHNHTEQKIGETKIEKSDAAAQVVAEKKADEGTAANVDRIILAVHSIDEQLNRRKALIGWATATAVLVVILTGSAISYLHG